MGRINLAQIQNPKSEIRNRSFTLIETIIVVGVTSMVLPIIFSIVFVILQEQTKIIRLQEVKRQGDFLLSSMKRTIQSNALQIYSESSMTNEKCNTKGSTYPLSGGDDGRTFFFKDKQGKWFNYYVILDAVTNVRKISSGSAIFPSNPIDLTTSKVSISSFSISCNRQSLFSPPIISLSLRVTYNTTSSRQEDQATLLYDTNIKLKSF